MLRKHNSVRVAQLNALKKAADVMASITSLGVGSGLDLNGLLGQLEQAEQEKLVPIQQQVESEQAQVSAYGQLQGGLSQFQASAAQLNDAELYESLATNVEGSAVTAATSNDAQPGRYEVSVSDLATSGSLATQRVSDPTDAITNGETLTFEFEAADAPAAEFAIAADSSLEDVRDAINASDDDRLNASIIFDGEGYRLSVNATQTGNDASIASTNFSQTMADNVALTDQQIIQSGQDASFNVNGIDITSPTNQVEGAVQGMTLSLEEANATSTITVEQDSQAISDAINSFVDDFNALKGTIGDLTAFNPETGRAGELNGDSATRNVEAALRGVLSSSVAGGELSVLSDVGISLQLDGTLALDQSQLDSVIANQPDQLAQFFAGTSAESGMAGQINDTLSQVLNETGAVQNAISGSERRIESLNDRFMRTEDRIDQTIDRYRTQFGQLDSMVAEMNATGNFLTQQLASLNQPAQGGGML